MYRKLIDYSDKKHKIESIGLLLRKLYENMIVKNLNIIYK